MGFSDGGPSWSSGQDRSGSINSGSSNSNGSNSSNAGGSQGVSRGAANLGTGKCKHLHGSNTCSNCSGNSLAKLIRCTPAALSSFVQAFTSRRRSLLLLCCVLSLGFLASSLSYQGAWNHSGKLVKELFFDAASVKILAIPQA